MISTLPVAAKVAVWSQLDEWLKDHAKRILEMARKTGLVPRFIDSLKEYSLEKDGRLWVSMTGYTCGSDEYDGIYAPLHVLEMTDFELEEWCIKERIKEAAAKEVENIRFKESQKKAEREAKERQYEQLKKELGKDG